MTASFKAMVSVCVAMVGLLAGMASAVTIETVPVGNPGNVGELSGASVGGHGPDRICGAVTYEYRIGKYEVAATQYVEFLNAVATTDTYGLYSTQMSNSEGCKIQQSGLPGSYTYSVAADWANRPVNFVSWGDAARFCNWLSNGRPTGPQSGATTEDGAYTLNGATSDTALLAITRNAAAKYVIPTEDEWYKAAYYDPHKPGGAGYWKYPTGTDVAPSNTLDPTGTNNANYCINLGNGNYSYTINAPYWRTEVGAFANCPSPYGTFDQGGNVWEWNEGLIQGPSNPIPQTYRLLRGGSLNTYAIGLNSAERYNFGFAPSREYGTLGFRVAYIPEPATFVMLALAGAGIIGRRTKA